MKIAKNETRKYRPGRHGSGPARAIGDNQEDYNVLEADVVVGRIFLVPTGPEGRPWMWASGHNGQSSRAAHGYEPTREAAMAAFVKGWRRE